MINVFAGADIREKYDYSKPRACVGLCFIRKLAGQPPVEYPPRARDRTPCVGMCFRTRSSGGKVAMRIRRGKIGSLALGSASLLSSRRLHLSQLMRQRKQLQFNKRKTFLREIILKLHK